MLLTSSKAKNKLLITFAVLSFIYFGSYYYFRNTNVEIWEKNQRAYVIFPPDRVYLYYIFRPISYVDTIITGIGFHIGPHQ
jgi:hypothetical protein